MIENHRFINLVPRVLTQNLVTIHYPYEMEIHHILLCFINQSSSRDKWSIMADLQTFGYYY